MTIKIKIPEPEKTRVRFEYQAIEDQRIEIIHSEEVVVTTFKYRVGIFGGKKLNETRRWIEEEE